MASNTRPKTVPDLRDIPLACFTVLKTCGSWAIFLTFLGATIGTCFGLFAGTPFNILIKEELDDLSIDNIQKAAYLAIKYCSTGGGLLGGAIGTMIGIAESVNDLDDRENKRKQKEEERKEEEKNRKKS